MYNILKTDESNLNNNQIVSPNFKKQGELVFLNSTNDTLKKINIELADDNYKRRTGLMYRKYMEENQGMLFISLFEEVQNFWMQDTYISLDMIFVNSKKEIIKIHKNTKPLTKNTYSSEKPAYYVVEVVAGFCDKYNIKENDKIYFLIQN